MGAQGQGTERTAVSTYVPAYQKDEWADHADRLGMTQSEFVRTMVQAGRRGFGVPDMESGGVDADQSEPQASGDDPDTFERRVEAALSDGEYLSWDELVAALTDDVESRLDKTLQRLQADDVVAYSGRHGGYTLTAERER